MGPLDGVRIVEIADEMGCYAGKLLADLGADVVLAEPREGSRARSIPPYWGGGEDVNCGIFHWWMNTNKRSVVLDLDDPQYPDRLEQLVRWADVLICSGAPAALAERGLEYKALAKINPRLVLTCITPFGLTGALANYAADDLILLAMGGLLYLAGYPGRAPTAVFGYQSYQAGSLFATAGTLIALYDAARTGRGQLVDTSIQECVAHALENAAQIYDLTGAVRVREGADQRDSGFGLFPCKDGLMFLVVDIPGGSSARAWSTLVEWLGDDPAADVFRDPLWLDPQYRISEPAKKRFYDAFTGYSLARTKKELYVSGQAHGVSLSPVATTADLADDDQLKARDFFVRVDHPELGVSFLYPGAPYRLRATPWSIRRRAPLLGEHTAAVWEEIAAASHIDGVQVDDEESRQSALGGIRVADFTWVGAGPFASKILADHGADVVKVETASRLDALRRSAPFAGESGINRSGYFSNRNSSKRGISLDLKTEEGLAIAKRLVESSDIVFNNFRPGAMDRFGLGYAEVAKLNPEIIYVDMPAFGNEGPARNYGGFGSSIAAACGLHVLSGNADELPVGTGTNFPDHVTNPLHAAIAILAALYYRHRTGEGQYVEIPQFESSVNAIGAALLTYQVTGEVFVRDGNRDGQHAPRVVLRCAGEDRWCAVSVQSEDQWQRLCGVANREDWLNDPRFQSLESRLQHQDALELELERWTVGQDSFAVMEMLQAAGVPAGVVQTAADLIDSDPSLVERHWRYLDHAEMGKSLYDAPPFKLSQTPGELRRPAPLLGEHTHEVLAELGYSEAEYSGFKSRGALE